MADHVLANTQTELSIVFAAGYADTDPIKVTITNEAGTVVVDAADATKDDQRAGRYTYVLAPQTALGPLTVKWAGTWDGAAESLETYIDVVGSRLFTISELRAFGDERADDLDKYPDGLVASVRDRITDYFRDRTGTSFTRRGGRFVLDAYGPGRVPVRPVTRLVSASIAGRVLTTEELDAIIVDTSGGFRLPGSSAIWIGGSAPWRSPTILSVEYGLQSPPAQIKYAALILARRELVTAEIDDRAVTLSNDLGTVRLSVPGPNYPTGIPIVDQAIRDYGPTMVIV